MLYGNVRIRTAQCVLAVFALLPLAGCWFDEEELPPLPTDVQVFTGTLLRAELSLLRRGTHVLHIDGVDTYFVESAQVPLSRYENKTVVLEGMLSHNVDPSFLPVLDVQSLVRVLDEDMRQWPLRSLGVTISLPDSWEGVLLHDRAFFHPAATSGAVITVALQRDPPVEAGQGIPMVIGGSKRALRIDMQDGAQIVFFAHRDASLVFQFSPLQPQDDSVSAAWMALLRSVQFHTADAPLPSTGSDGAPPGTPCGGSAGILCPEGYFCEIYDLQENVGTCSPLSSLFEAVSQ